MSSEPALPAPSAGRVRPGRSPVVCALIGVAVMAAVDEIVFHQILRRHHFYDHSTPGIGLLSDGLLHTAELLALATVLAAHWDTATGRTRRRSVTARSGSRPSAAV